MATTVTDYSPAKSIRQQLRDTAAAQRRLGTPHLTPAAAARNEPGGVVASARRLTTEDRAGRDKKKLAGAGAAQPWQEEAWELQDLIGEQRFLSNTLAGRMGQAALYVGRTSPDAAPGTRPEVVEDASIQTILDGIGDGAAGVSQLLFRGGVNLFVAGEFWLVGIPPEKIPGTPEYEAWNAPDAARIRQLMPVDRSAPISTRELTEEEVLRMTWRVLSVDEISVESGGAVKLTLEDGTSIESEDDSLYLIRIWRPHPRRAWEADSPTRSSLPVLRELLGLTMHISAQIDSRLAGAGILVISSEASAALKRAAGIPESSSQEPLLDALMTAMTTAVKDRASASALVPIVVSVPGESVEHVKHITFDTPLDKEAKNLRDEAIRRLALGQDAPPELLLGVGGMNHWGAWLVREDVVKTHLEPPLALICDALTTQYLRPILAARGMSPEEVAEYQVWYDVDHLIERPNRSQDAKDLYDRGILKESAVRAASGFEEDDAPDQPKVTETDPAVEMALRMVEQAPSLSQSPGIPGLVMQIQAVLDGPEATARAAAQAAAAEQAPSEEIVVGEAEERNAEGGVPDSSPDDAPSGTPANPGGAR